MNTLEMITIGELRSLRKSQINAYTAYEIFAVWEKFKNEKFIGLSQDSYVEHNIDKRMKECDLAQKRIYTSQKYHISVYKQFFEKCFAGIHELRADEVLAEYNEEKLNEIKIVKKITEIPLDMQREIETFCVEIEYQKKKNKYEYIVDNADKVMLKLQSYSQNKIYKLWYRTRYLMTIKYTTIIEHMYPMTEKYDNLIDEIWDNLGMSKYTANRKEKYEIEAVWCDSWEVSMLDVYSIFRAILFL